jgi:hypothetical protein
MLNNYPMPFYHLNGELNEKTTIEQMKGSQYIGYGGVALLPVTETRPEFLTDEYFCQYEFFLKEAKKLGMQVILYDDLDFPSGTAGNKITEFQGHVAKALIMVEGKANEKMKLNGYLCSAVINKKTRQTFELADFDTNNLTDDFTIYHYYLKAAGQTAVCDYLNPEACKKFISISLDPYFERFEEYFGDTIVMIFTDDIAFYHTLNAKHWTHIYNKEFEKEYGFSPVKYYPALWEDIGENTLAARAMLHGFRAELLSRGFIKLQSEWAAEKGILATGHQSGSRIANPIWHVGDHIKFLKHMTIPGMDNIFGYRVYADAYKLISSAAISYNREIVMCETYGASYPTHFEVMSCLIEQYLKGINLIVPHGEWYNQSHVRIPPDLNYNSKSYSSILKPYNELAGNLARLLRPGKTQLEIGVIYPVESLLSSKEMDFSDEFMDYVNTEKSIPDFVDYFDVGNCLSDKIRRDFVYLHPEVLLENCEIIDGYLVLNGLQKIKTVVLTGATIISVKTLEILLALKQSGGNVIYSGLLPNKSAEFGRDEQVKKLINQLFDGKKSKSFNENDLIAEFLAIPNNQVVIDCDKAVTNGTLTYIHRGDIYCFGNTSSLEVNTKIKIKGDFVPIFHNPYTNESSSVSYTHKNGFICFDYKFASLDVLFVSFEI